MPNFYDYFALFTNQSCKFAAIYQHPPSLSAFSRTNRMILIGILQMQHMSSDFTIWKKFLVAVVTPRYIRLFGFHRDPKTKATSGLLRRWLSTAKRGMLKYKQSTQDQHASHIKTREPTPKQYQTYPAASSGFQEYGYDYALRCSAYSALRA